MRIYQLVSLFFQEWVGIKKRANISYLSLIVLALVIGDLQGYSQSSNLPNGQLSKVMKSFSFSSKEELINNFINTYPLSSDNKLKLSAYAELKGHFSDSLQSLRLDFGSLGRVFFFSNNCLLRNRNNEVYYIDKQNPKASQIKAFNVGIQQIFEQINLTGNYNAATSQIDFIAQHLAQKNIEPFYKLFVRYLLVNYGEFDSIQRTVTFHSNFISKSTTAMDSLHIEELANKHTTPLKIVLSDNDIKGYYLEVGGQVYIENDRNKGFYVSGEDYKYNNVTAFKLFVSKMFSQSIQYIAPLESKRIAKLTKDEGLRDGVLEQASASAHYTPRSVKVKSMAPQNLYTPYSWIGMMLNILRVNQLNIGDPDIIKYFVDRPYFTKIYDQLLPEEKIKVDHYLSKKEKKMYYRGIDAKQGVARSNNSNKMELKASIRVKDSRWFLNRYHVQP